LGNCLDEEFQVGLEIREKLSLGLESGGQTLDELLLFDELCLENVNSFLVEILACKFCKFIGDKYGRDRRLGFS
jgi:hypothetical protein